MGLYVHGMGGFFPDKCYEVTGYKPDEFDICAVGVVGYWGETDRLTEGEKKKESPLACVRKEIEEISQKF